MSGNQVPIRTRSSSAGSTEGKVEVEKRIGVM